MKRSISKHSATIDGVEITYSVVVGHTFKEWNNKYDQFFHWDFNPEDIKNGAITPNDGQIYWEIQDEFGLTRWFEADEF